ncbi:NAD-dependent epimerase/dehydratase family protein [Streptomyces chryseus]|uniref:NAD-dependent epimerase/dehydratase family protein n=1 Tax=Streptomyces chryseus TaxID=68186 RepID=UPI00110FE4C3|nr:NAD-dependent epimerase/dehydratase family protein [Streptomyces chryseus]GGX39839.1 epimerase [Streptomyces chryseus]
MYTLEELAGSTVLVTGGAGLIGSRITARLRALGARPVALCTLDAYPEQVYRELFGVRADDPDVVVADVRDADRVRVEVAGCDYVVHAAAIADVAACTRTPRAALEANIIGTQSVLDAVAACDRVRRMVFVSSASVYGNGNPDDWAPVRDEHRTTRDLLASVYGRTPPQFHEDRPQHPMSVYANTKTFGETQTALVLDAVGTSYAVVRYFSVYGEPQVIKPGSHSWVVAWFTTCATLGLPLHLNGGGHQIRDLVHVEDIAEGTLRALIAPDGHRQTLNIGTGMPTSIREVARLVAAHYPGTQFHETPMPPGDPLGGYASTGRMQALLNWRPSVDIVTGVARYATWLERTPQAIPDWLRTAATADRDRLR